jgi:hypothetical protein
MKLTKFSLMNPNEVDKFEELQRVKFRPNSFEQAKSIANTLKEGLEKKLKKLGKEEKAMLVRLDNLLKGNSAFDGFTSIDYLTDILSKDTPGNRIAIARLMKDTNKGIADIDKQISFPFTDGSKPTEKYAKLRLIEEFGVSSKDFMLLPDAGPSRLLLDEKGKKLSFAKDLNTKSKVRSIDAISNLKNVVIIWCMKYKGGTAAVGGSGQKDQGTTEGAHMAEIVERLHADGNSLVYNGKPVFFANMVYGGQFNDPKRIFENEMSFKSDKECVRSFNISIDAVKNVMNLLDNPKTNLDSAVDTLYNKYGYDIEYTGKLKPQEITRLKKYV